MINETWTIALIAVCLVNVIIYIGAEWRGWKITGWFSKLAASTAFVALAAAPGAANSEYGRFIMVALILSWLGDGLLLSLRSPFLLAGMTAFFLAHMAFAVAITSLPIDKIWLTISLIVSGSAGLVFLRWLWKYLLPFYQIAVPAYLAAISLMASVAIAASAATWSPVLAVGAIAFAASDVSVALNRFVERKIINKVWGLPLYYSAQILFALSVRSHG